ncbi:MAG TPA: hypothetical protein VIL74_14235 [Pyrinomonadaceae bacterium]|jgi:hypothetical protein
MKHAAYLLLGFGLSLFGALGYSFFSQPTAAQKAAGVQWEYAAVTAAFSFNPTKDRTNKIPGIAVICYLQNNGCRLTEVKHEVDYTGYLQERLLPLDENNQARVNAGVRASEIAFQKALAQLGGEGWEIVSDPQLDFEFVDYDNYLKFEDRSVFFNRKNTKAVYFKRLKK